MQRLLVLFIDAFRPDYLTAQVTPFLYALARKNQASLHPLLGYSDAIRATIYTGAFPDQHNYWMAYRYSPETSPFRLYSAFRWLDRFPSDFARRGLKVILSRTLGRFGARWQQRQTLDLQNIPFAAARFFDYTLHQDMTTAKSVNGFPTLFGLLREHGVLYYYLDTAKLKSLSTLRGWQCYFSSARIAPYVLQQISNLNSDIQLIWIYIHHIDNGAHRYGIHSERFKQELRDVDRLSESIVETISQRFGERPKILCFSDHGMAHTEQFVDLTRFWQAPGFGRDYLLFLDSSMVQLWYLSEVGRSVREAVGQLGYGHFLTNAERQQLHLNFAHRYYGDDIYLLDPCFSIFPNFISMLKPYAMHAYHPDHPTQQGIFIDDTDALPNLSHKSVQLEEIMPTILEFFGIQPPETCQGQSLFEVA